MGLLEDAIKIANDTRSAILSGQNSLTTNFLGFISVSQMMGRNNDLDWATKELNGYADDSDAPEYRSVYGILTVGGVEFRPSPSKRFCSTPMLTSVYRLIGLAKSTTPITLFLDQDQLANITHKQYGNKLPDNSFVVNNNEISKIIGKIELQLILRLNNMLSELTYEKIPQDIFQGFQDKVNHYLSQSNPNAVSALNLAYASLEGSEDPNRAAQVSLACRRLIKYVADEVFPPNPQNYTLNVNGNSISLDVSDSKVLNRLTAYADSLKLSIRKQILAQVDLLRQFYSGDEGIINKGLHDEISVTEAKRMVLFTYVLLGDILLAKEKSEHLSYNQN